MAAPSLPLGVTEELLGLVLGEHLGTGVDRQVYACKYDPARVIKVTVGEYDFQNVAEWMLWQAADTKLRRWLAPCYGITPGGKVLIMARCERPVPVHLHPKKVPECLAEDFHSGNIGWYEGRVVCTDYGRHAATMMAANAKRMVFPEVLEDYPRSW